MVGVHLFSYECLRCVVPTPVMALPVLYFRCGVFVCLLLGSFQIPLSCASVFLYILLSLGYCNCVVILKSFLI